MDIKRLDTRAMASKGAWLTIKDIETNKDTDGKIRFMGTDSKEIQEYIKERNRKEAKAEIPDNESNIDDKMIDLLVKATIEWEGFTDDGKDFECTPENAEWLYHNSPDVVEKQIVPFVVDRKTFFINVSNS